MARKQEKHDVYVVVLGNMQDGGMPHAGCRCPRCRAAFADPLRASWAAGLALVDARVEAARVWLFDATPDVKYQINLLAPILGAHPTRRDRLRQPDGLFLTHGHMGHTGGLVHFGPEAMAVSRLPLYASAGLITVLQRSALWQATLSAFSLQTVQGGQEISLGPDLSVTPIPVPHRDEWQAGTFAYRIRGPRRSLLYLPDIDSWGGWPEAHATLETVAVALVDASFYSSSEIGGRPPVAHPLVPDTLRFMKGLPVELVLTHLNHTNPLLDEHSPERAEVLAAGVAIAAPGMTLFL